ncbi:MAG: hypothetical protein DRQ88_07815 [Epsilonproteobacteria bacterium]|nr:MAG: hypothetical protein DRQ89_07215 [Campylobacterota bacterium]RLA66099.1 MAG: hypothetical protein DRQ88_07815 [Campylobacterota bacterium]
MIKTGLKFIIFSLCLSSCAFFNKVSTAPDEIAPKVKNKFKLKDGSGEYSLLVEAGPGKGDKTYVVKRTIETLGNKNRKTLEKSISISSKIEGELIPKISQFSVWYNKHRHFSQIEMDLKEKQIKVTWDSPDPKFNGIKYFPIKNDKIIFCFFTQVIECARQQGFLKKATKNEGGQLRMQIVWDGHPFFQQQFENFNTHVTSPAVLEYDGRNRRRQKRFSLKVEGNAIFYFVDKTNQLMGQYWIAKGLAIERLK